MTTRHFTVITIIARHELRRAIRNRVLPVAVTSLTILLILAGLIASQTNEQLNRQQTRYQQDVRRNWIEQPDRHPHRASHYGYLAFRPRLSLAFFDFGIDSFAGNTIFLEAHRQNSVNFSEANLSGSLRRAGELSPAMILQLLVPLVIFFLGFAMITSERENGTLQMLLSQGVTPRQLLMGKTLAIAGMTLLLTLPGMALILLSQSQLSGGLRDDLVWRSICLVGGYGLYLLICALIAIIASSIRSTSRDSLILLTICWIVFCLILPRGLQTLGATLSPNPVRAEFDARLEDELAREGDSHDPDDPHFRTLREETLRQYNVASINELPFNYGAYVMLEAEKISSGIFQRHYNELLGTFTRQNRFAEWATLIDPYLAIRSLSMAIAGTDLGHYSRYQQQAENFRYTMIQKLNRIHLEEIRYENDRAQRVNRERWQDFPDFKYEPPGFREVITGQWRAILSLSIWSLILLFVVTRLRPEVAK